MLKSINILKFVSEYIVDYRIDNLIEFILLHKLIAAAHNIIKRKISYEMRDEI